MHLRSQTGGMTATTFQPSQATSPRRPPRLDELLDRELDYGVGAQGGFVNHLAMTLVAAWRLGAPEARLAEIYEEQAGDGYLIRAPRPDWLDEETARVVERGFRVTVAEQLPPLLSSLDARWFHAVIRVEHAVDVQHPGQLARALGDWREVARPLPDLPERRGDRALRDVIQELALERIGADLGGLRLRAVAEHPRFRRALESARLGPDALREAAELALLGHVARNDFATLHLVTGACAARALAPLLSPAERVVLGERLAQAVSAGYLAGGGGQLPMPLALEELRSRPVPVWDDIAARAAQSDDAHVSKLVYACRREQQETGEPLYQWLAARQCGTA